MSNRFDTSEYVKGLTLSGLARAQARTVADAMPEGSATRADIDRLHAELVALDVRAKADMRVLRWTTLAGMTCLSLALLVLHLAR
jgi:hypothetical protein